MNCARSDDAKSLKPAILDWIMPKGQALFPPLRRNSKHDRGFNHVRTGALLCPAHLDFSNKEWVKYFGVSITAYNPQQNPGEAGEWRNWSEWAWLAHFSVCRWTLRCRGSVERIASRIPPSPGERHWLLASRFWLSVALRHTNIFSCHPTRLRKNLNLHGQVMQKFTKWARSRRHPLRMLRHM